MNVFIKQLVKHKIRTSKSFDNYLNEILKSEKFSSSELGELKLEKFQKVIRIAAQSVPFYRDYFKTMKLTPNDFKTIEDVKKLPVIDKHIVKNRENEFKNQDYKGLIFKAYTSGTSGTPGLLYRDLDSIIKEHAFLWRQYLWAGKPFKSKQVVLRGELLFSATRNKKPFWKYNHLSGQLFMSSYHLNDINIKHYLDEINNFGAFDLYSYPSTGYQLAHYCKLQSIPLSFKCLFTSSEMLFPYQKDLMEKCFSGKIYDWYGNAERVSAICQCEHGCYHDMEDYSINEYIPVGNNQYEIIGTSLINSAMPLIRYRTGDIISIDKSQTCSCSRKFKRISSIVGRHNDCLKFRDGRRLQLIDNIFKGLLFIKEAQFVQYDYDEIHLNIVPVASFETKQKKMLIERIRKYISDETVSFKINMVSSIQRSSCGKFSLIKNNMK